VLSLSGKLIYICYKPAQCVELDFQYASEGIHRRWDAGFRITACAATPDQAAFVLSVPRRRPMDETQETLRTSAFPSTHVKVRRSPTAASSVPGHQRRCDPRVTDFDDGPSTSTGRSRPVLRKHTHPAVF